MPINNRSSPAASTGRSSPGEPSVLVPREDAVPLGREWDWRPRQTPAPTHTSMVSSCLSMIGEGRGKNRDSGHWGAGGGGGGLGGREDTWTLEGNIGLGLGARGM
uniref:Uncharacterized protein n=1 Tax=Vombatus ursinus TaxID=29139 RepID=A0A4X2JQB5_VOMUR